MEDVTFACHMSDQVGKFAEKNNNSKNLTLSLSL